MKITLISGSRIPSRTANSIQTMKMAQAITTVGHQVQVIVPGETPKQSWDEMAAHYGLQQQFPIRWIKVIPQLRSYDFGLRAVSAARRWGADLILTRHPQAAAISSRLGYPTILEVHDMPSGNMGPRLMRMFLRSRGAEKLVVITLALAQALATEYHLPPQEDFVCIAPDGVDLERYENLPAPRKARTLLDLPQGFTVGYSGHLYAGRGVDLIFEMAERLPEVNFLIMGGEEAAVRQVSEQAAQQGLKNVQLMGFIPNQELPSYQAACEALIMPYQQKVAASSGGDIARYLSPMKMFEYLASGRAVLASHLPVFREVLQEGRNALILPAEDAAAWVDAIKKLQSDPDYRVRLGENGRATAARYTWERRVSHILGDLTL